MKLTKSMRNALKSALLSERCGMRGGRVNYHYMTGMGLWNRGLVDINNRLTEKGRQVAIQAGIPAEIDATWGKGFGKQD